NHIGNLSIDVGIEHSVAGPNHGFVVVERIPSDCDARSNVVLVGSQSRCLRIHIVAKPVVQSEIPAYLPRILPVERAQGTAIPVNRSADARVTKSLLIEQG